LSQSREGSKVLLADTDLFFFFLRGGRLEERAAGVIDEAEKGVLQIRTSSEVYDDAVSAIRSDGYPLELARAFVSDMKSIPHTPLPMSAEVAEEAMDLYIRHGGRRRLSYFDAFHVATARRYELRLLTSDRYILANASTLGVLPFDLARYGG
jgi:predicted nucleic acid-binding protein